MNKRRLMIVLAAFVLLLSGCEIDYEEIRQIVIDIAMDWAKQHALEVAKHTFTGSSGDAEVDAVLGARDMIQNLNAADELMEQGRSEGDLDKMAKAVEMRPGDYTYRTSYASALLKNGDTDMAQQEFVDADEAVRGYSSDHAQAYADHGIDELGMMRPDFEKNGFASADQCRLYNGRMAYFYEIKAATGEAYFREQRDAYRAKEAACQ
ncbi:MAG: hypothetical protein GX557_15040 [Chloroflexi bacterium]|nr:hypothetical protein [Chloroflexota bacterium]